MYGDATPQFFGTYLLNHPDVAAAEGPQPDEELIRGLHAIEQARRVRLSVVVGNSGGATAYDASVEAPLGLSPPAYHLLDIAPGNRRTLTFTSVKPNFDAREADFALNYDPTQSVPNAQALFWIGTALLALVVIVVLRDIYLVGTHEDSTQ